MFVSEVVVVQGMNDVRAALRTRPRAVLLSAHGAGIWAGAGFWRALMALAEQEFPGRIEADILDCADAPGQAMAALRAGCRHVILDPACPAYDAVAGAAAACDAIILPHPPAKTHSDRPRDNPERLE